MIDFILANRHNMDPNTPLGASILACLATCFFAAGQVREFTVQRLNGFNPNIHVSRSRVSYDQDWEGQQVTILHIPHTKASPQGEDMCWARQEGPMDPDTALAHHLEINNPPPDGHLFAYRHKNGYRPLYLRKHAQILAPYIQAAPVVHDTFVCLTMPAVR